MSTRSVVGFVAITAILLVPGASRARAESHLTLLRAVPSEVHFAGCWHSSPERKRIEQAYLNAIQRLIDSGIGADFLDLLGSHASPGEREAMRAWANRVLELIKTPNWGALFRNEVAFAFRVSMPVPEYLLLCRVKEGTATKRLGEFRTVFQSVAEFAPDMLSVNEVERDAAKIVTLQPAGVPVSLSAAAKGDVVALSTSSLLLEVSLGLIGKDDPAGSIEADERFRAAFSGLAEPEDGKFYFHLGGYMNFFRGLVGMARAQVGEDENAAGALTVVDTIIDEIARFDTIAGVEWTEKNRIFVDVRVAMGQKGGGPGFLERVIAEQRPVTGFERLVPKNATGFYMSSGVDLLKIYDAVVKQIQEHVPRGGRALEKWGRIQENIGFNLREDLLSWLEGGSGWICIPKGGRSSGNDHVFFLRTRDQEKVMALVTGIAKKIRKFLEGRGQQIEFAEIEELGEEFREVRLAAIPCLRPALAAPDGALVFATSKDALLRIRERMEDERPSILENPRFAALGVPQDAHLVEVYYQDIEGALEGVATLLGAIGLVTSIVPENRDSRPILKLGAVLTKLSVFVREIDLGLDYAGWTRYDPESHAFFARQMTRVRVPPRGDKAREAKKPKPRREKRSKAGSDESAEF